MSRTTRPATAGTSTDNWDLQVTNCRGKKPYPSRNHAIGEAVTRVSDGLVDKLEVYQCPVCGYYHLTRG